MAGEMKLSPEKTWFSWTVLALAVLGALGLYQKFDNIEDVGKDQFAKLDTRAAVLETNSKNANDVLKEIGATLKVIAEKQNTESLNTTVRLTLLEERVDKIERKADGK